MKPSTRRRKDPPRSAARTAASASPTTTADATSAAPPGLDGGPPLPAAEGVEVRRSPIHGLGLFATRDIDPGARIGVYAGPRSERVDTYVLWIEDEDGREYGIEGQNEMRFVNHSREPNACFEGEELVSLRRIEPDEEITHHYGEDWEDL